MSDRPNVVLFISDDQGYWAVGSENDEISSPNLDRLGELGLRFDSLFCVSPVCSPARASLYTGLTPSQHGLHDHVREPHYGRESVDYLGETATISDVLRSHGYKTGLIGKWHLGAAMRRGTSYDRWYVLPGGMDTYNGATIIDETTVRCEPEYLTYAIAREAVDFIQEAAADESPFCLLVPFTAPHSPWVDQHPRKFTAMFEDCAFDSCPQEPPHPWGPTSRHPDMQEAVRNPRPSLIGYFAAIAAMDEAIGRVVECLENSSLMGETVIGFLSDNGFSCGHHGIWGKGNATFPPNLFEESVRVPGVLRWPDGPSGLRYSGLASGYDFLPTIHALSANDLSGYVGPGRSIAKEIGGGSFETRSVHDFVVVYAEYGPVRMIRTAQEKLVLRSPYGPNEFYVLSEDPDERFNRIDDLSLKKRQGELRTALHDWFEMFSEPWADGRGAAITGSGQLGLMGSHGTSGEPFPLPLANSLPWQDLRDLPMREGSYEPEADS